MFGMETIGDRLKALRLAKGINQVQAAEVAGTTKQAVSQIESGRTQNPGGLTLYSWARFYDVNLEWLVTGRGSKSAQSMRLSPEIITVTQQVLEKYLRLTKLPEHLKRDPFLLSATLSVVLACDGDVKDIDQTEVVFKLIDDVGLTGGANAVERGNTERRKEEATG
jgi:transcriptional regulator with XRE-family HTH domain